MNELAVKAEGAYEAWKDLLSRFSEKQRMEIANLLAHDWGVEGLRLERNGAYQIYTPDSVHSKSRGRKTEKRIKLKVVRGVRT